MGSSNESPESPLRMASVRSLPRKDAELVENRLRLPLQPRQIPRLKLSETQTKAKLGEGAFSSVFVVQLLHQSNFQASVTSCGSVCNSYALKRLHSNKPFDKTEAQQAVAVEHLLLEAELLSKLPAHPNIVQLCATSHTLADAEHGFLVLERLHETLSFRLQKWEMSSRIKHKRFAKRVPFWNIPLKQELRRQDQRDRLDICALGMARALQHLHHHQIIFRDFKPSNLGFSMDGTHIKLFDFGLSRSLPQNPEDRRMTRACGSFRFMAPEVFSTTNYSLSADIYSLGMVLYQVCTLKKPFDHCSKMEDWILTAVTRQQRPNLKHVALPRLRGLIQACWDPKPAKRPSIDEAIELLEPKHHWRKDSITTAGST